MKAFQRGDKIVIRKNEDYPVIEGLIQQVSKALGEVKAACEDKNFEVFPYESVESVVEKVEKLKTMGTDTFINENFINFVKETKDVSKYFEGRFEKSKQEQETYNKKKKYFSKFAKDLEDMLF